MTKPSSIDALVASLAPDVSGASRADRAGRAASPAPTPETAKLFSAALDRKDAAMPQPSVSVIPRGSKTGELKPEQQFEGFMLRTFVESMLPSENSSFYGEGTAGGIWKSMLAERIGDEMAAAGGIGIADMLTERASQKATKAAGEAVLKAKASEAGSIAFRGF